jgi:hypothetical protein
MLKKTHILNWEAILVRSLNRSLSLIILLNCFFLSSCNSESGKKETPSAIKSVAIPIVENFFSILEKGQAEKAVLYLLESNSGIPKDDSLFIKTVEELTNLPLNAGSFVDYVFLKEKKVLDIVEVYVYLVRYENLYYRFLFEFYNNKKSIKFSRFNLDNHIGGEIEESLKLYM